MGAVVTAFDGRPLALNPADTTFMNDRGVIFTTDERLASAIQEIKIG